MVADGPSSHATATWDNDDTDGGRTRGMGAKGIRRDGWMVGVVKSRRKIQQARLLYRSRVKLLIVG